MAKKQNPTEELDAYIQQLPSPLQELVTEIRQIILQTDKEIGEQVKWNSPSFYYTGEMQDFNPKEYKRDIIVINLHKGYPLLVFPTGAKIQDASGLLEGDYKDGRRLMPILDKESLLAKKEGLQLIIKSWLNLVDK